LVVVVVEHIKHRQTQAVLVVVQKQTFKVGHLEQPTKVIEAVTKPVVVFLVQAVAVQAQPELTLVRLADPQAEQV
jgi:hypothetical protein